MRTCRLDAGRRGPLRPGAKAAALAPRRAVSVLDADGTAGSLFPSRPFAGTVHSVFRSAVNIRAEGEAYLVSLVADPLRLHPRAACARADFRFAEVGAACLFDGRVLAFPVRSGANEPSYPVRASRDAAAEKVPRLLPDSPAASRSLEAGLAAAETEIGFLRAASGAEGSLDAGAQEAALALDAGFAARNGEAAAAAADRLIGRGPGLTPAGDDFLCGYLAARRAAADFGPDGRFLDAWCALLRSGLRGKTGEISAAFLSAAAEGLFARCLVAFARSFEAPAGARAMRTAAMDLASLGHSSGLDAAEGFLFGLRRLFGRRE